MLVSAETVLDSHRICVASPETEIGLQRALFVSTETCFQEVARGALAMLTSLCLRTVLLVSEAEIASLLALSGASFLTSRLRSLALSALVFR